MTYFESADGITISQKRTKQELENHGASWQEFIEDNGEHVVYDAQQVLLWLGY